MTVFDDNLIHMAGKSAKALKAEHVQGRTFQRHKTDSDKDMWPQMAKPDFNCSCPCGGLHPQIKVTSPSQVQVYAE